MDDISSQLKQLAKDVSVAERIDGKRAVFSAWFAVALLLAIPIAIGIYWPELFIGAAALTSVLAGLVYGIMICSLQGCIIGFGLGLTAYYGGDIISKYYGQDFVLIDPVTLIYVASVVCLFSLLPYLTTMIIHGVWSLTKRSIPGMTFIDGFSWSTYDQVNKFKETIASDEVTDYVEKRSQESYHLYKFELSRLEEINAQFSTGMTKECKDWEPRAREQKCMSCKLKGVCPFQPGSALEHLGDSHL